MRSRHKVIFGFTLIEIIISLSILALGLVSLFNFFPLGLSALRYARRVNDVALFAQKQLEHIKTFPDTSELSGETENFTWQMNRAPLDLEDGIKVTVVELKIDYEFGGSAIEERFVTYLDY